MAVVLFDGSLGTSPTSQGWVFGADPLIGHSVSQTAHPGYTELNSLSPRADKGGYFSENPIFPAQAHPQFPATLDRVAGFTVRVDLRVVAEGHNARDDNNDGVDDRAGCSIVIVTDDLMALEIGFWEDEVWAYDDDSVSAQNLFTHAEGGLIDTTAMMRMYELSIQGSSYAMWADGTLLMTGPLRDYSSFSGFPDVYAIANFMFLGDDTSSAESHVEVGHIEITDDVMFPCDGDADGDGLVNSNDLGFVIFRLGDSGTPGTVPGDVDGNGVVNTVDISYVIFRLGSC